MSFLQSNFLLKVVKIKKIIYLIHQIDNRPKNSFTFSQLCLLSVKWIFFNYRVFEMESCRLGRSVGRSVSEWSVVGWLVVSGFNGTDLIKPIKNTKIWNLAIREIRFLWNGKTWVGGIGNLIFGKNQSHESNTI